MNILFYVFLGSIALTAHGQTPAQESFTPFTKKRQVGTPPPPIVESGREQAAIGEPPTVAVPENSAAQEASAPTENQPELVTEKTFDQAAIEEISEEELAKEEGILFNFENASLANILDDVADRLGVTFISPDTVKPANQQQTPSYGQTAQQTKGLENVKVSFRTENPLTKAQAWTMVHLFLEAAGFALIPIPGTHDAFYRIMQTQAANKEALPTYIGVSPESLPDAGRIRYVHFLNNSTPKQISDVLMKLKSKEALIIPFDGLKAVIMSDNGYNIKSLMKIVSALDSASTIVELSVLKLKEADATDVEKFYNTLKGTDPNRQPVYAAPKKEPTLYYFPQDVKLIAEQRSNSLIIIGPRDAVRRVENFISEHLDKQSARGNETIHTYQLEYMSADQIAGILRRVTQFGQQGTPGGVVGVRGDDRYFGRMSFSAEKQSNTLIVRSSREDFELIKPTIAQLDRKQPQVAIEVFIVDLQFDKNKALQSQMNSKNERRVNAQTSGFSGSGIITDPTSGSIVTNLIKLATVAFNGSSVLTLGKESVWAILSMLDKSVHTNIVSNPFLVATNKYTAQVTLGETRRVDTETVFSGQNSTSGQEGVDANLTVEITPQINVLGIVNLNISVNITSFISTDESSGNTKTQMVQTNANVADGEVLALGGIIRDRQATQKTGVPILSKIPILGSLFTNRNSTNSKQNLVIFIAPRIINTDDTMVHTYTQNKIQDVHQELNRIDCEQYHGRDPIYRWFFSETSAQSSRTMTNDFFEDNTKSDNAPGCHAEVVLPRPHKEKAQ